MSPLSNDSFHFMIYWVSTWYRYDGVEWKVGRRVVLPPVVSPSGSFISIRPKRADFHGTIPIANFAVKNAMFNLNENNRIVMAQHPSDMRMGVNCLCGQVRMAGLDPSNGDVYIFVGRSRKVMKILHWEYGGYVVYYKRLEEGRFHPRIFLRQGVGFRSMKWSELVLLMEGISPKVARRHRYEKR